MPIDTLTAKANTGAGTDGLAGLATGGGFAGAVVGVNGSDVERLATEASLAALVAATAVEDTPSPGGERGFVVLAQRRDSDSTATSADGDYATLKMDEAGRLKTASQPAKYALVTGTITASGQTVFCQCDRGSNIIAHMVATSLVGHNVTFEGSIDSTNGTDGAWFAIDAKRTNANTVELVTGVLAATPAYAWELSVNGFNFIRVRATAHTSGTATWKFQQAPYATEPIPVTQVTAAQPVTLTSTTVTASTPATPTASIVNSAATTNATVVKASAGTIYGVVASNTNAAARFLKLHNSATVTPGTTAVALTIPIPPGAVVSLDFGPQGMRYGTGICLSITGAAADADTTAIGAGEVKVNVAFI